MSSSALRQRLPLLVLLALPVLVFYFIVIRLAVDIPLFDDYHAALEFTAHLLKLPSGGARWLYLAEAQHNEYKIILAHAFVWWQLQLLGHLNFRWLSILSDSFVLFLLVVLWKMFLPLEKDLTRRMTLFLPVPFLMAQMQYWENVNWSMSGLQHLPILGFSFLTIYLLGKRTDAAWWGAAVAMLLAIAASGNGFLLIPIGALMLVVHRRWVGLLGWLVTSALSVWVYSYHYVMSAAKNGHGSMASALLHPKVLLIMTFMGAAGASPLRWGAYPVGLAIVCFMLWMIVRGYTRRNLVVCCCALFCILTAVGVAGIRDHGDGLIASTASRYTMYSDLLLILCWYATVEEFVLSRKLPLRRNVIYCAALALSILFWMGNTYRGTRSLAVRAGMEKHGIALYEHLDPASASPDGPIYLVPAGTEDGWVGFQLHARDVLKEAHANGVYDPPRY